MTRLNYPYHHKKSEQQCGQRAFSLKVLFRLEYLSTLPIIAPMYDSSYSSSSVHDSPYSWFRLTITLIIAVFANTGMWAVVTIMPALETDFETARSVTSLPFTLTMIGFAVGNLVIGRIIDRFGVIISVIAAAIASASAYYLASQTQYFHLLTAFHLLLGFGTAAGFGPLISDISHWFLKQRGIAVALIASGNYLAGGLWPLFLSDILLKMVGEKLTKY